MSRVTGGFERDKEFIDELKSQYERHLRHKDSLDSKASSMITMSSTLTSFF